MIKSSLQLNLPAQILLDEIDCSCLAMHEDGTLYTSDWKNNEVRRWKKGETEGAIVAVGNRRGNQLSSPIFLFIDDDHTLYISDRDNDRVVKWVRDIKEGVLVAGGNGRSDRLTQLSHLQGILVDECGQIYVADCWNDRIEKFERDFD